MCSLIALKFMESTSNCRPNLNCWVGVVEIGLWQSKLPSMFAKIETYFAPDFISVTISFFSKNTNFVWEFKKKNNPELNEYQKREREREI